MNSESFESDLAALRRMWEERAARMREILRRFDHTGMTRPARDTEERDWIAESGGEPFIEDDRFANEARAYYARRYRR